MGRGISRTADLPRLTTTDGTCWGVVHAPPSRERLCCARPCVSIKFDPFLDKFCLCGSSHYNPAQRRSVHLYPCVGAVIASYLKGDFPANRFDFLIFVLLLLCGSLVGNVPRALPVFPGIMFTTILFFFFSLLTLSTQQKNPLKDFCRLFGHSTTVVDRKLYIDGGLVNWSPISQTSLNYSSTRSSQTQLL
jgi:hypothetical protein